MTEVSVWTYPWDLADLGVQTAVDRIGGAGGSMVSLATSYHAGRFLQPGNPRRRVYFPQDGTVYYRPNPARWVGATIQPMQADIVATEGDMLAELIARRDKGGLNVSAWTVCLHNTRLGLLHLDHVMRTAHGDPQFYALCPSSPAARAYVVGLVAEIAQVYAPDRIELESPDFMGFSHGFHHEKDGLPAQPEDEFLLGLCFCAHCRAGAVAAGVPVDEAQHIVAGLLDAAFARELPQVQFPDFATQRINAFVGFPALYAFLLWRSQPITSLIAEIRSVVPPATQLLLIDAEVFWSGGIDLADVIPHLDGILHCAYFTPTDRIGPLMAQTRALLGPDKSLIAGFQLLHPNIRDRADLAARVRQTRGETGGQVDGLCFYNLGLVPPARLDWIRTALG